MTAVSGTVLYKQMSLEFCFLEDHPHEIGEFIDLKRNYERYIAAILNSSFVESWRIQPHGFAFSWFLDQICFRVTRNRLTNGAIVSTIILVFSPAKVKR